MLLEDASRTLLVRAHEPAVSGNIGGQDGGQSTFDTALPWIGHGAPLRGPVYTETTAS
jgi:hypothetical protein